MLERIKIEHTEVYGFRASIRGMRNPMDSWHLSDSRPCTAEEVRRMELELPEDMISEAYLIGDKDLDLAVRLTKAGTEHCKFLRQIRVWSDLTVPRYIWSELDTYHFNTKNSCSTMHKLFNAKKEITEEQFMYSEVDKEKLDKDIEYLNKLREEYLKSKDTDILRRGKQVLPEGFLQKRTWDTNYQELLGIYFQRRHHRLDDWKPICSWIESLPYMNRFIHAIEGARKPKVIEKVIATPVDYIAGA